MIMIMTMVDFREQERPEVLEVFFCSDFRGPDALIPRNGNLGCWREPIDNSIWCQQIPMIFEESPLCVNSTNHFSPSWIVFSIRQVGKLHGALSYLRRALQMEVGVVTKVSNDSPCRLDGLPIRLEWDNDFQWTLFGTQAERHSVGNYHE